MNNFDNNNNNKYELITTDYILQEKTDKNGQNYYLIIDKQGERKNFDGTDIGYFCFPLKMDNPNYPGGAFASIKELCERGYKTNENEPCVELKLLISEYTSQHGKQTRSVLKAEWSK